MTYSKNCVGLYCFLFLFFLFFVVITSITIFGVIELLKDAFTKTEFLHQKLARWNIAGSKRCSVVAVSSSSYYSGLRL